MRGRGLKRLGLYDDIRIWPSPPMRGRGLKRIDEHNPISLLTSPPMRGRGLKHNGVRVWAGGHCVAPHAGAWIETVTALLIRLVVIVAPHAGAWIETARSS